jgi:ABC-type Fe3+/spermidine/putrescine transport system ATPase subunit
VGITFIYVTHDQEEALALSDRIAVMDHGHVEQLGTPEELYDAPRTLFVAGFIGTSNLLPGTVESVEADTAAVRLLAGELVLARAGDARVGDAVDVAVRPETVTMEIAGGAGAASTSSSPQHGLALDAEVLQSAYLGVSVSHHVRTTAGVTLAVVVPRSHERPGIGDAVRVRWRAADAMVLPRPESGEPVEEIP